MNKTNSGEKGDDAMWNWEREKEIDRNNLKERKSITTRVGRERRRKRSYMKAECIDNRLLLRGKAKLICTIDSGTTLQNALTTETHVHTYRVRCGEEENEVHLVSSLSSTFFFRLHSYPASKKASRRRGLAAAAGAMKNLEYIMTTMWNLASRRQVIVTA